MVWKGHRNSVHLRSGGWAGSAKVAPQIVPEQHRKGTWEGGHSINVLDLMPNLPGKTMRMGNETILQEIVGICAYEDSFHIIKKRAIGDKSPTVCKAIEQISGGRKCAGATLPTELFVPKPFRTHRPNAKVRCSNVRRNKMRQ